MTQPLSRPLTPSEDETQQIVAKETTPKSKKFDCVPEGLKFLSPEEMKRLSSMEPMLLDKNEAREYALELDKVNRDIKQMYDNAKRSYWIPEEVDLTDDAKDIPQLTKGEKHLIKTALAFFLRADNQIIENHATVFMREFKWNEVI